MKRQELRQVLQGLAAQAVPADRDVWPALRERLSERPRRTLPQRLIPATRLGWLTFALAMLFVFSIAAYAAGPWFTRVLKKDARLQHVDLSQSQPLHLSQAIDGVTVTLDWAYADTDWVLVGYTLRTSDGRRFDPYHEALTDTAGVAFPWQSEYGVSGHSDLLKVTLPAGEGSFVGIFENVSASRTLEVRFTVSAQEVVLSAAPSAPPTTEDSGTTTMLTPVPVGSLVGPFMFDFTIPVVSSER